MLEKIRKHKILSRCLKNGCSEHKVEVKISPDIPFGSYLIIDPKKFYEELKVKETPPNVDCVIVVHCRNDVYSLHIVELKSTSKEDNVSFKNTEQKFRHCFDDFMAKHHKDIFMRSYQDIELYFVSNINSSKNKRDKYNRKNSGQKLEALIKTPIVFQEKRYLIKPYAPNHMINPC